MTFNEWVEKLTSINGRYEHLKDVEFTFERRDFLKRYKKGLTPNEALKEEIVEYGV